MPQSVFAPALAVLAERERQGFPWTEPQSWQEYCAVHKLGKLKTAQYISLQHQGELKPGLVAANAMLLRVGKGTFSLVRATEGIETFFLQPTERQLEAETFLPELSFAEWYQFHLLGTLIEANAVQLAIATGLLGHVLGLDRPWPRVTPATSHSTWRFPFYPLASRPDCVFDYEGQVEIDAAFLARRDGRWCFFVVEAKHSAKPYALAKHKLTFAMQALATRGGPGDPGSPIPPDISFVPVFMRSWSKGGTAMYEVVECAGMRPDAVAAVDALMPVTRRLLGLPLRFG